jgi:hypothetical protein
LFICKCTCRVDTLQWAWVISLRCRCAILSAIMFSVAVRQRFLTLPDSSWCALTCEYVTGSILSSLWAVCIMSAWGTKFHFGDIESCYIVSIYFIMPMLSRCIVHTWSAGLTEQWCTRMKRCAGRQTVCFRSQWICHLWVCFGWSLSCGNHKVVDHNCPSKRWYSGFRVIERRRWDLINDSPKKVVYCRRGTDREAHTAQV